MGLERLCRDQRPGHRCWAFGYDVAVISAETNFLDPEVCSSGHRPPPSVNPVSWVSDVNRVGEAKDPRELDT